MKKLLDVLFCLLFVGILLLPFLFANFKKDQASELDNTYLPELKWDDDTAVEKRIADLEEYLNMRIGFRQEMLTVYQKLNDKLFNIMDHPLYMYGKDGYVFLKNERYVEDYQHLNLNQEEAEQFAQWMQTFSDLMAERGIDFYYLLIPDKKTLYPEYFPSGYNILGEVSQSQLYREELAKTHVDWIYAYDAMAAAKADTQIANRKYDAGHCNNNGTFVFCKLLIDHIREKHPELPELRKESFDISYSVMSYLPNSYFPINEEIPVYHLREKNYYSRSSWLESHLTFPQKDSYRRRYINSDHPELPKLLVFMDSYLHQKEFFLINSFSEVTFIHRQNVTGPAQFQAYVDALHPDIVVFENPERSFPIQFYKDK